MEPPNALAVFDELPPQFDGRLIRYQLAATGVFDEYSRKGVGRTQRTEHVTAGTMEEMRNRSQNLALCAFARAGRTEQQNGFVFHDSDSVRRDVEGLGVLVFDVNLLNFEERHLHLLRCTAAMHIQVQIVGRDTGDARSHKLPSCRFYQ